MFIAGLFQSTTLTINTRGQYWYRFGFLFLIDFNPTLCILLCSEMIDHKNKRHHVTFCC